MPDINQKYLLDGAQSGLACRFALYRWAEDITVSATTNDASTTIPAGAIILGATASIVTAVSGTGVTTCIVGTAGNTDCLLTYAELGSALTAGTAGVGAGAGGTTKVGTLQTAAFTPRVTVNGSAAWAGKVRVVVYYVKPTDAVGVGDFPSS